MSAPAPAVARRDDTGLGLVEVVVAMVLLGILALAFLPLVAQTTRAAATGATVATATRLVSKQMELARSPGTTCASLGAGVSDVDLRDGRGAVYRVTTTVSGCPGLARYEVSVAAAGAPTRVLASASTYVTVETP